MDTHRHYCSFLVHWLGVGRKGEENMLNPNQKNPKVLNHHFSSVVDVFNTLSDPYCESLWVFIDYVVLSGIFVT